MQSLNPWHVLGGFFLLHVSLCMQIDIKTGVPIPRGHMSWPHKAMDVGEYFEVPAEKVSMSSVYVANHRWGKRLGRKFVCRKEGDVVRVWRVA